MVGSTQPVTNGGNDSNGIDPDARNDVTVVITEYYVEAGQEASRITTFECNKAILLKSADHFVRLWRKDPKADLITFDRRGDTLDGLEAWLGTFHGRVPQDLLDIPRHQLWRIIEIGNNYGFYPNGHLKDFFAAWLARNVSFDALKLDIARELVLPCYLFNHAEGFAQVTKWLVYNHGGPMTERKPVVQIRFRPGFALPDFIGAMNQARVRLKTILHSRLWLHPRNLLRTPHLCECWKVTISEYLSELVNLEVFPLDDFLHRASLSDITHRIRQFKHHSAAPNCTTCNINWVGVVFRAVRATEAYFDGLCLDCMERSRGRDGDENYWRQCGSVDKLWDSRCRITHGEPSWYVSWLGRNDHKQKLLAMKYKGEVADFRGGGSEAHSPVEEAHWPAEDLHSPVAEAHSPVAEAHSPAGEAKVESPVEETEAELQAEESKAETPTGETQAKSLMEENKAQTPTEDTQAKSTVEEAKVEPMEETKEESPMEIAQVKTPVEDAPAKPSAEEAQKKPTAEDAQAQSMTEDAKVEPLADETQPMPPAEEVQAMLPAEDTKGDPPADKAKTESPADHAQVMPPTDEAKTESPVEEAKGELLADKAETVSTVNDSQAIPPADEAKTEPSADEAKTEPSADEARTESPTDKVQAMLPADEAQAMSVDEAQATPVDKVQAVPANDVQTIPTDDAQATPADKVQAIPADEAQVIPADEAQSKPPVKEIKAESRADGGKAKVEPPVEDAQAKAPVEAVQAKPPADEAKGEPAAEETPSAAEAKPKHNYRASSSPYESTEEWSWLW